VEGGKVGIERNAEEKEGQADPSGVCFAGIAAEEVATCARRAEATVMVVDEDEEPNHREVGKSWQGRAQNQVGPTHQQDYAGGWEEEVGNCSVAGNMDEEPSTEVLELDQVESMGDTQIAVDSSLDLEHVGHKFDLSDRVKMHS